MVIEEVKMFKEEHRTATAVTQSKECAWTTWNDIEPIKLSWNILFATEPLAILFLLQSPKCDKPKNVGIQLQICIFV